MTLHSDPDGVASLALVALDGDGSMVHAGGAVVPLDEAPPGDGMIVQDTGKAYVVRSGETRSGLTLNAGDTLTVLAGGKAEDTLIKAGGVEYVDARGLSDEDMIFSGGKMMVAAGGEAVGVTVSSGGLLVDNGEVTYGAAAATTLAGTVTGGGLIVQDGPGALDLGAISAALPISRDVTVLGVDGPWLTAENPHLGYDGSTGQTASVSAGFTFTAGQTVTITYLSGTVGTEAGDPQFDAGGDHNFVTDGPGVRDTTFPSQWIPASPDPIYCGELLGAFANAAGQVIGSPFVVGDGPTTVTVPGAGVTQLLLGVNDQGYDDNNGSLQIEVTEGDSSTVPLALSGGLTFTNASVVNQVGVVTLTDGTIVNQAGATWNLANGVLLGAGGTGSFSNAGTLAKTDSAPLNHVAVDFTTTGQVSIAGGTLDFTGAANNLGGTVNGAGTLALGAPTGISATTLMVGLALLVANLEIEGAGTTVTLGAALKYAGSFVQSGGTLAQGGSALTLSGPASFGSTLAAAAAPVVSGPGTLAAHGTTSIVGPLTLGTGVVFDNGGVANQGGVVTVAGILDNTAKATWNLANGLSGPGKFTNAGTLAKTGSALLNHVSVDFASTGTVDVEGGSLDFIGPVSTFTGTINGGGTLAFGASTGASVATLAAHLDLAVSNLSITGAGTTVKLGAAQTYGGSFVQGGGTLDLARFHLTLTGSASFGTGSASVAVITGPGTLVARGPVSLHGRLTLSGGAVFDNAESLTQTGTLILARGTFDNAGTYDLTANTGMALAAGETGTFDNTGTLAKTVGTGVSIIGVNVANAGTLVADSGTLEVTGAVTGNGTVEIGSGTADFASTFSQDVIFNGGTAVLELGKAVDYGGTITGLSTTGANSIDLADINFTNGKTSAAYAGSAAAGTLTITDGTHAAKIKLAGDYLAAKFTLISDGHGGATVYDPSTAPSGTTVRLAAAMAGFGGALDGGPAAVSTGSWTREQPTLVFPRAFA